MLPLTVMPIFVFGKSFLSTFVSKIVRDKTGRRGYARIVVKIMEFKKADEKTIPSS